MEAAVDVRDTKVEEWHTTEIRFRGFADLPAEPGFEVQSPEFVCCGIRWSVALYPGGNNNDGYVSIYLEKRTEGSVDVNFGFAMIDQDGLIVFEDVHCEHPAGVLASWNYDYGNYQSYGVPMFVKRSIVLECLTDGEMVVLLRILPSNATGNSRPFLPENPFSKNVTMLFLDEETSDVKFEVGARMEGNQKKTGKKATDFHAHQLILKDNAPILAELVDSGGSLGTLPITVPIEDVSADVFRLLLLYVYGGKIETEFMKAKAKEIIDVADRFGVAGLKLEAEACYVESLELSIENLIDHLLYSDAKSCALLKETAMDFVMVHRVEVLNKVSFDDCPGSLTKDLLAAMTRAAMNFGDEDDEDELRALTISDLRHRVHERGLDVDGSRETLIAMLRENS